MIKKKYLNIELYNKLWLESKITTPLVILIGGYCGTGKSTFAQKISQKIPYMNIVPTPIIRCTVREFYPKDILPCLHEHTFDFYKFAKKDTFCEDIFNNFELQVKPISKTINHIIDFASTERQHYIIEGNHVLPGHANQCKDVILVEIYSWVRDEGKHLEMMTAPTHRRTLNNIQFKTGRLLQEYIVDKAISKGANLLNYDKLDTMGLSIIDEAIEKWLNENYFKSTKTNGYKMRFKYI